MTMIAARKCAEQKSEHEKKENRLETMFRRGEKQMRKIFSLEFSACCTNIRSGGGLKGRSKVGNVKCYAVCVCV